MIYHVSSSLVSICEYFDIKYCIIVLLVLSLLLLAELVGYLIKPYQVTCCAFPLLHTYVVNFILKTKCVALNCLIRIVQYYHQVSTLHLESEGAETMEIELQITLYDKN